MNKSEKLLKEIKDEIHLSEISGGYNPGPSIVWGAIMNGFRPCSWPGNFYGNPAPVRGGVCTSR